MKLFILGYAESGKDELAQTLSLYSGFQYIPTSLYIAEKFMFERLKGQHEYKNANECYLGRRSLRKEWYEGINDYNKDNPTQLIEDFFEEYDCYIGLRCRDQFNHFKVNCNKYNYLSIWIDCGDRVPPEKTCTITKDMADLIILNDGSEHEFKERGFILGQVLKGKF